MTVSAKDVALKTTNVTEAELTFQVGKFYLVDEQLEEKQVPIFGCDVFDPIFSLIFHYQYQIVTFRNRVSATFWAFH